MRWLTLWHGIKKMMYKFRDVKRVEGDYYLPGSMIVQNCISVTAVLEMLGIGSSRHKPGTTNPNQAKIGTKSHQLLEKQEFNSNSVGDFNFMSAMTEVLPDYQIADNEIFCWYSNYSMNYSMNYSIIGVTDALLTKESKDKKSFTLTLAEWKTTGQDEGMGKETIFRAMCQTALYALMMHDAYKLNINEVIIFELHNRRNVLQHVMIPSEIKVLGEFLLDCISSRKKIREIEDLPEKVRQLQQRARRSKTA